MSFLSALAHQDLAPHLDPWYGREAIKAAEIGEVQLNNNTRTPVYAIMGAIPDEGWGLPNTTHESCALVGNSESLLREYLGAGTHSIKGYRLLSGIKLTVLCTRYQ